MIYGISESAILCQIFLSCFWKPDQDSVLPLPLTYMFFHLPSTSPKGGSSSHGLLHVSHHCHDNRLTLHFYKYKMVMCWAGVPLSPVQECILLLCGVSFIKAASPQVRGAVLLFLVPKVTYFYHFFNKHSKWKVPSSYFEPCNC